MNQTPAVGYILFAHGSSIESANEAVRTVASQFAASGAYDAVEAAFLEGGSPDLVTSVSRLAERGVGRVIVIPYFLTLGLHLKRDLPKLVEQACEAHPALSIEVTPPLDGHPALIDALIGRAQGAEAASAN
jgi:sirohydrochlorin ferrochelatase